MWAEFKRFAMRGNVVDMAVGIIIGAAFTAIVNSLVNDILMPPIGYVLGNVDFANLFLVIREGTNPDLVAPYASLADARTAGAVVIAYGEFINRLISFLIVAFAVFLLVRVMLRALEEKPAPAAAPAMKDCPRCLSSIPVKATKCPHCTADLGA
jgi:large conductance mechanosensitive channel